MLFKHRVKLFLNMNVHAKFAKIRKNDVFLVSFPKSGNTWLRFLIGNYMHEKVDFSNVNELVPDIHICGCKHLQKMEEQRFIKSHFTFNPTYPKVIYIKRNIKDVLISYFFWYKKVDPIKFNNFDQFFDLFVENGAGIYGTWLSHVNNWINEAKDSQILVINYEDLKENTIKEMEKILNFCDIPIDKQKLISAIKNSDIKNMSKLEKNQKNHDFFNRFSNNDVNFVSSKPEDRNQKLSPKQKQILIELNNKIL
jgi:predicted nucleotidyltransferase